MAFSAGNAALQCHARVDHTVIRRESIVVEKLHEWPEDQAGEKIMEA